MHTHSCYTCFIGGEQIDKQRKIEAVQRMQDYIAEHIHEPISLYDLSRRAYYSPFHCARVFKELTGKSPFDYIRALRLTHAALKLRDGQVKVIDVAFYFVFGSHAGFTRAFAREFGVTPHKYSKGAPPIHLFMPNSVRERHHYFMKAEKSMRGEKSVNKKQISNTVFVQVIERPERKLILKRGIRAQNYIEYCEEVGCEIWGLLCSIKEALYEPVGMWLPEPFRTAGSSVYVQGVEVPVSYSGIVPVGCELITLPACKMMVFQGQPFDDEHFDEAISDLWEVMTGYKPELYGFEWAYDDAPRFQMEPQGYRGYIEARPVCEINK